MASRFTRPRKVKAHAEQPGPRGPVGSYCIGPETRKAKGAGDSCRISDIVCEGKGQARRREHYLLKPRTVPRPHDTDGHGQDSGCHALTAAGRAAPARYTSRPGIRVYGRTRTYAHSQVRGSAPGAGPVCRHPNRLLQRGTGTQRLVHNGQYSNSYSLGPPRRAALGAAGR